MKKQINDILLKMQSGENCIGETATLLEQLFLNSSSENAVLEEGGKAEVVGNAVYHVFSDGDIVELHSRNSHDRWLCTDGSCWNYVFTTDLKPIK